MNRKYLFVSLIGLIVTIVFASASAASAAQLNTGAGPWQWVHPLVQGTTINDISFVNDNTGWAVGQGGTIIKTTDGGTTWSAQNSGTTYNVTGVDFVDSNTGWAVGNLGEFTSFVIKTTDGGATWNPQTLSGTFSSAVLEDVDFVSSSRGVTVGNGKVYYTTNGGATWNQVTNGSGAGQVSASHYLLRVQMVDASVGYAVGQTGVIYKTTNGGSQWNLQASGVTSDLKGLYFKDTEDGVVVGSAAGSGRVLKTDDGGATWTANNTGSAPIATPLNDVAMTGSNTMVAAGSNGSIFYYDNSELWGTQTVDDWANGLNGGGRSSGSSSAINDLQFSSGSIAYAAGAAGLISRSNDLGGSWSLKAGGDTYNLTAISFVDSNTGWAAGAGGRVRKTTDGGDNWTNDNSGLPADFQIYDIDFVDATYGVAVGCQGGSCPGTATAYRYNSGTWTTMGGITGTALYDVNMATSTAGWAVGAGGTAFQTSNGTSWVANSGGIAANYEFNGVDTDTVNTPADRAWAVGNNTSNGKAVYAVYNGSVWSVSADVDGTSFFVDVDMVDTTTGYLVGSGGAVRKTTDGGWNWTAQSSGTGKLLAGVSFLNADYGFAVGEDGRLIHTTDGGANWGAENLGNNVSFFDVATVGERRAFVAGGNGAVMKSLRSYFYTWYDDINSNNWVLMANPVGGSTLWFDLFIGGSKRTLAGDGQVTAGTSLTPKYSGVIGGPVNTSSLTSAKAIVSQRVVWPKGGSSLEEVLGMDVDRLSNHYYWTWYDQVSAGYTNWVLVANPNPFTVYYQIKVAGVPQKTGTIPAGKNVTPTLSGVIGGPVEVLAWNDAINGANKADVFASQRVLSNYGGAFNEQVGTPAEELSSRYLWTWYDDRGGSNWILIANPSGSPMHYEIKIAGIVVETTKTGEPDAKAVIPAGGKVTPRFGITGGPVEVKTFTDATHTTPMNSIASQRVLWGPSFAETSGYPYSALSSSYHWTWYDQVTPGMKNWVLVANPSDSATVTYQIKIAGVTQPCPGGSCNLAPGQRVTPTFSGQQAGPVEVTSTGGPVMASQRVLYNNYFNEVLGTVLD
ncbi:MAG: WD40/YVTN/BNR-like repeat-containing protein [Thermoleophilia bacterium]